MVGKEDCLYIYVYVPREEIKGNMELLNVIAHVHGGAFMVGSPSVLAGPDYIMDRDVVYVSFNYRLGVLGTKDIVWGCIEKFFAYCRSKRI